MKHQHVSITSAEAGYLTSGSWNGITKGFELTGYCHECDAIDAVLTVTDYFLNLDTYCVTAKGNYTCCGSESIVAFGILDKKLREYALAIVSDE